MTDGENKRTRIDVRGRVQGVGFRPFVYRLAEEMDLSGLVGNNTHGAFIEVEGKKDNIRTFCRMLRDELPPLAEISSLSSEDIPTRGQKQFRIETSLSNGEQDAEITPDASICDDCLKELFDPNDRRYGYPFINCTNCGPRYSIIQGIPYDRPNTTMSKFTMCPECQAEYDDPSNRRFHAQPNACSICGPEVCLIDNSGGRIDGDPIKKCAEMLKRGEIVAIKGLGGFHLACLAENDGVVGRLRDRKSREAKPFAIMVRDIEAAGELCKIDRVSASALEDISRPIVLVPKKEGNTISKAVAPNSDSFGIMFPYTPLHYLIFAEDPGPLVMTSGNPSEEPLCSDNEEAVERLSSIADAFLLHNRDIERRVDDSIVKVFSLPDNDMKEKSSVVPIRRARGYVPLRISVPRISSGPVLAVGGEMKSAVCLMDGTEAVMSEHLGELTNPAAYRNFVSAIDCFKSLLKIEPEVVAYDMHPDYAATRYAKQSGLKGVPVQHHHAHIVSCMTENGITGNVVGLACDGTGYGLDGNIWGCEILLCNNAEFQRAGHLLNFPLLGGDSAARQTWRPASGVLHETFGEDWITATATALKHLDTNTVRLTAQRLKSSRNTPLTSSLGRLFDAAAFLLGICDENRYEAEAAMTLEDRASYVKRPDAFPYGIIDANYPESPMLLDWRPMIKEMMESHRSGTAIDQTAAAFHETVAQMLANGVDYIAEKAGLDRVVLSGGCFANRILLQRICGILIKNGREVIVHSKVPAGDGGIALGQAVVAAENLAKGNT